MEHIDNDNKCRGKRVEKNIFVIKFILNSVIKEFIRPDNIDKFFSIIYTYTHT